MVDATVTAASGQQHIQVQPQDSEVRIDEEGRPKFPPAKEAARKHIAETRKVLIPPHRITPLKSAWPKMYPPLVEHLKLQVRMNVKARAVEMRTSKFTTDSGALQKGEDFVKAFSLGFDVDDAIALLRLDDLYIEVCKVFPGKQTSTDFQADIRNKGCKNSEWRTSWSSHRQNSRKGWQN